MRLFEPWKRSKQLAALEKDVGLVWGRVDAVRSELIHELSKRVVELEARIARETLSWTELYDKTYHLQKRIEQRRRVPDEPTEETPKIVVDEITERVRQRRNKGRTA